MKKITRLTPAGQNFGILYFTSNSLTNDDKTIFLIGREHGVRNLYCMNTDGTYLKQITDIPKDQNIKESFNPPVMLDCGIDNIYAEPALDTKGGNIFYYRQRQIVRADRNGNNTVLAELPIGNIVSVMHVSESGKKLLLATTDARAFLYDNTDSYNLTVDDTVQSMGLSAVLRVFDTRTGEQILKERVPRAWITHVQFNPANDDLIMYNHEWPHDCGVRRMWMFDGENHVMVRTEGEGRSRKDWTCHEMWSRDGSELVYHGTYDGGRSYLGCARINDPEDILPIRLTEIPFPEEYVSYGHFTMGNGHDVFTDGYFRLLGDPEDKSKYICRLKIDWDAGKIDWQPLCEHNSTWATQDSHPHPILNHKGDRLYFNSDFEGFRAVYYVDVD